MPQVDLNKLRQTVLSNRDTGEARPLDPSRQVHVDRLGNIVVDDPRSGGQPLSEVHQSTFATGRLSPVVRVLDSVVRSIEERIAAHPPERGGALLGPRDCAVITHFLHDEEAETTATTYSPSRALNERVKDLERRTALEFKGLIHSHPGGLDHPSAQDARELGIGLHLNGHMGGYLALIVTGGPAAEVHCHEIVLPSGKLSCFKAFRGPRRTASVVPSAVEVIPVLGHLERLSHEYGGQAPEEFLTDVGAGPMPAGRIQLDGIEVLVIASTLFPAVPPIVLVTPEGGETEQLPIAWPLAVPPEDRLLSAVAPFLVKPGPFRRAYGPAGGPAVTTDPGKARLARWPARFTGQDPDEALEAVNAGLFARSSGLVSRALRSRTVLVAGTGSVGSYVAEQLVRSGVGKMVLLDPDAVEAANLSRTCFEAVDVGRPKVEALARRLLQINPALDTELRPHPVQEIEPADLDEMVKSADLVVAATDDPDAQRALNRFAYARERPALFVGLYAGARGGEVIMSIPGRTPCYLCATRTRHQAVATVPRVEREVDYGTGRLHGEIALGVDIQHVAGAAVKLGLSLLLPTETDAQLRLFAEEALLAGMPYCTLSTVRNYWFYPQVFGDVPGQGAWQSVWLSPTSSEECAVCGVPGWRVDPLEVPAGAPSQLSEAAAS